MHIIYQQTTAIVPLMCLSHCCNQREQLPDGPISISGQRHFQVSRSRRFGRLNFFHFNITRDMIYRI